MRVRLNLRDGYPQYMSFFSAGAGSKAHDHFPRSSVQNKEVWAPGLGIPLWLYILTTKPNSPENVKDSLPQNDSSEGRYRKQIYIWAKTGASPQ